MSWMNSEGGNPLTMYVNMHQSKQERRDKYAFCRFMGVYSAWARVMRDYHWTQINARLERKSQPPCGTLSTAHQGGIHNN